MKFTDQCIKREISSLKLLDENVTRTLLDTTALLGHANCELIQRRRDMIRPDLNNQYKQIGDEHVGFTDWMVGKDLPKQIQDISATGNRVGQSYKATNLGCLKLEGLKVTCLFVKLGQTLNRPTKDAKLILTSSLTRRSHLAYTNLETKKLRQ